MAKPAALSGKARQHRSAVYAPDGDVRLGHGEGLRRSGHCGGRSIGGLLTRWLKSETSNGQEPSPSTPRSTVRRRSVPFGPFCLSFTLPPAKLGPKFRSRRERQLHFSTRIKLAPLRVSCCQPPVRLIGVADVHVTLQFSNGYTTIHPASPSPREPSSAFLGSGAADRTPNCRNNTSARRISLSCHRRPGHILVGTHKPCTKRCPSPTP